MINDLCNDMRLEELVYSVVWEFSKFDPCSKALTNVWTSVASLWKKDEKTTAPRENNQARQTPEGQLLGESRGKMM